MGCRGIVPALLLAVALSGGAGRSFAAPPNLGHWAEPELQGFFDALRDARSNQEARKIEDNIEKRLAKSDSPTIALLLDRAKRAQSVGDLDAARELLTKSVVLDPDYAEGYRRRGEIAAARREYAQAIDDLTQAVKLQPKHYLAMQSLGKLYEDGRDRETAIAYYQTALSLDPWLEPAQAGLKRLGLSQSQIGAANALKPGAKAAEAKTMGKGGV